MQAGISDLPRQLAGIQLGHGGVLNSLMPVLILPAGIISQLAGCFHLGGQVCQGVADHLELGQGTVERFPLVNIFQGGVQCGIGAGNRQHRGYQALQQEAVHDVIKTEILPANPLALRHFHIMETDFRGIGAAPADLA